MNWQQLKYLIGAAAGRFSNKRMRCPECGRAKCHVISRKKVITALVQCQECCLRFRVPQDPDPHYFDFYQTDYTSSLATQCPSEESLREMLTSAFVGTEKNFAHRIEIIKALGLSAGSQLLDYGASWGYATWQFRRAGFDASGFEISRPRAVYAREKVGVNVLDSTEQLADKSYDCMFSCHVLEHIPAPRVALALARRVLKPAGLFVAFTPNGSEASRLAYPDNYDHSWGRLHPLYLNAEYYQKALVNQPFLLTSANYGQNYDLEQLRSWDRTKTKVLDLTGRELLVAIAF